ncbi:MAG: M56 family metallopeptidase [Lachnospira sp.]
MATITADSHGGISHSGNVSDYSSRNIWITLVLLIYYCGVVFLLCRDLISLIYLSIMIGKNEKRNVEGLTVCILKDSYIAPFSWGKYVFMNNSESINPEGCIFLHEKAHTEKHHWIDVLLTELFCVFLWYNPFAWMTRQLVKLNHEYEADFEVLQSGISAYEYQHLLVVKAIGQRSIHLANSFASNKNNFRKRVLIMSKQRSSRWVPYIALLAISSIAISLIIVSLPLSASILNSVNDNTISLSSLLPQGTQGSQAKDAVLIDSLPEFEGGNSALNIFIIQNIRFPKPQSENESQQTRQVNVQFVVDENGNVVNAHVPDARNDEYEAESVRIIELTSGKWHPAVSNGKKVSCTLAVPITFSQM